MAMRNACAIRRPSLYIGARNKTLVDTADLRDYFYNNLRKASCKQYTSYLIREGSGIHSREDELFKVFGYRDQSIVDHDIFRIDGIDMIYIDNIGLVRPVKLISG